MTVSAAEQQLAHHLRASGTSWAADATGPALLTVLDQLSTGGWRRWATTFPVVLFVRPSAQHSQGTAQDQQAGPPTDTPEARLRAALTEVGVAPEAVDHFAVAALAAGALRTGADLSGVSVSAPDDDSRAAAGRGVDDRPVQAAPDLAVRTADAARVLDLVGSLTRLTAHLEGTLVGVVGDLTVRNGTILPAQKGAAGPDDLTPDQTRRWRARAKSATRREIEALTGWGEGEVSDLVALATSPAAVQAPVVASMEAGVTPWRLARRFLRELSHEAHEDTAEAADRLFGTDPQTVCTSRLDPDGDVKDGPWEHKLFNQSLQGEATRLASRDPQTAARNRHRNRNKRDARVVVHEDGTGSVTVSGIASQVTAVADRLERGARAARGAGDPRTLADLRADIGMSLLMHSGLALPDPLPADADDLVRTRWTEQMRAVLHALPRAVLNVIVPFDALVHSPQRPLFGSALFRGRAHGGSAPQDVVGTRPPDDAGPWRDAGPPHEGACPSPGSTTPAAGHSPPEHRDPAEILSLGLATGAFPQFLTPDAIRELALAPGTTLHRILMDPADGRCVERSVSSYTPDAAMRAQVHAADVTCRAPGCVQHAPYTQLDHVVAHGAGGPTSESNLQDLHSRHHQDKTHGGWEAVMAPNRDVTWTSLLGRIYRTRAHDYRQYSTLLRDAVAAVHDDAEQALTDDRAAHARARAEGRVTSGIDGRGEPRVTAPLTRQAALSDAVDRAVYRALTYRGPARPLRSGDDDPDCETRPGFLGWDAISLTHVQPDGRRRHGPDPATADTERAAQRAADVGDAAGAGAGAGAGGDTDTGSPGATDATGWREAPDQSPPPF